MTFNRGCVNPKSRNFGCALDPSTQPHSKDLEKFKVVKVRTNRAYICRWALKAEQGIQTELYDMFGIASHSWQGECKICEIEEAGYSSEWLGYA